MDDYASYDAMGLAELVRKGEVSASELLGEAVSRAEAAQHGLTNLYHERAESIQAENRANQIEWTKLVFEKT